jgi:hypothetical protein
MTKFCSQLAGLLFGLSMCVAIAQQPVESPTDGMRKPRAVPDCTKLLNAEKKARCEVREKAFEKCQHTKGNAHRACMREALPKKTE